ncbi:hypothetical protein [Burkholderia sp. L27(2015)]|uniref:hypothetical protein n=1 Tax=Burkholderia sp. L27(2015) TaxID=1641858 RepID=UPI00131D0DB3|nr:hypothetical protein [Burkholderia sp. L27(2015)]
MSSAELKTDSLQRWMMYSKDTYENGRIFLTTEQKKAVAEGKKFSQGAYADIWAKDAALVRRVRSFLGTNFYWHQRLAKSGADLEVIQTLQAMIRGESVVLIAEQSRTGGVSNDPAPKLKKLPSFREELMTNLGMSYDAATAYMIRYNEIVEKIHEMEARSANRAASSSGDAASDRSQTATSLGDAQPFEYTPDEVSGDTEELAASTTNPGYAAKMLGYDSKTFRGMIHRFKDRNGLGPADNSIFHDSGAVEFNGTIFEDNIHDYAP